MPNTPFCFLHIPRTAGTTLNVILNGNFEPDETLSLYSDKDFKECRTLSEDVLAKIKLIQGHIILQSYDPPRIYSRDVRAFTFLREPVSRLESEYHFLGTWKDSHMFAVIHENKMSFRDYITSENKYVVYKGKNFMTRALSGHAITSDATGEKALSAAKRNLEQQFAFFGIQELFNESLVMLAKWMGLRNILYEKRNVLEKARRQPLSEEDRGIAAAYNKLDIELYAFALPLFKQRLAQGGEVLARDIKRFQFLNQKIQNVFNAINTREGVSASDGVWMPKS